MGVGTASSRRRSRVGCHRVRIRSHYDGVTGGGSVVWLDWGSLCEDGLARWRCEWVRGSGLAC